MDLSPSVKEFSSRNWEKKQQISFTVTKLKFVQTGVFTNQPTEQNGKTCPFITELGRLDEQDWFFEKDSWSLFIEGIFLVYANEHDDLILEGHTFPCFSLMVFVSKHSNIFVFLFGFFRKYVYCSTSLMSLDSCLSWITVTGWKLKYSFKNTGIYAEKIIKSISPKVFQ